MQGPYLRKYGVATTVPVVLYETDGVNFKTDAEHATGDTKITKDEGAEANTASGFVDEGQAYSIALSATEMQAARIVILIADQGTKAWLDTAIVVETYGNPSAMHAFDLDTALAVDTDGRVDVSKVVGEDQTGGNIINLIDLLNENIDTKLDAIQAKTDQLTFSATNELDSNVKSVKSQEVVGSGIASDPWRPA